MKKIRAFKLGTNLYNLFSDEASSKTYREHYSDASFWGKLKSYAKTAGMKAVYPALLLQYMMKSDEVSIKTKLIISAALGYFILPIDFIPDFAPLIGFGDDVAVLMLILKQMASHVTPEIKRQAREHLHKWFNETNNEELDDLERRFAQDQPSQ